MSPKCKTITNGSKNKDISTLGIKPKSINLYRDLFPIPVYTYNGGISLQYKTTLH